MAEDEPHFTPKERWTFIVRVGVSTLFLAGALFIILSDRYPDATIKWAFGIAGIVIGYWLR
jgi:hypothetical protein